MKTRLHATAIILFVLGSLMTVSAQSVHWKKMKNPIEQTPNSIQKIGKYLFMTTKQCGIHRSSDGGETWEMTFVINYNSIRSGSGCSEIADSNGVLIVECSYPNYPPLSSFRGIARSLDTGKTWSIERKNSEDVPVKTLIYSNNVSLRHNRERYSDYIYNGIVYYKDEDTWESFYDENIQHVFKTQNEIVLISDKGIYISGSDTFSPQLKQKFPKGIDSTSYAVRNDTLFISRNRTLYISTDKGETWLIKKLPFSARHIQVNSSVLIVCDMLGNIWFSKDYGNSWYKWLDAVEKDNHITYFYADNEQLIFGIYRVGIKRYSLHFDKPLPRNISLNVPTPYTLKITDRGVCMSAPFNSNEYFSGFCNTTDLGKTWKFYDITPWGPNDAVVHSGVKYKNGCFSYFSTTYHSNFEFCFNSDIVNGGGYGKWRLYDVEIGDVTVNISKQLGWINLYRNSVIIDSFITYLPEFPKKKNYEDLPYLKFHAMGDTLVYRILDTVPNTIYYSTDFGKRWTLYNDWRLVYGDSGVPMPFGNMIIRKNIHRGYQVFNRNIGSWYDMYDSEWSNFSIYDYDYNDSIFVISNEKGIFYITPDDLSEITSVEEMSNKTESNFIVSPLPFDETLNITLNNHDGNEPYTVILYDSMGRKKFVLVNQTTESIILDTGELNDGVYFIEISTNNTRKVNKVIKIGG